jgi:class 3 adenylate cyclase/pimeloyl-ACP methyl ester carboxylesterase
MRLPSRARSRIRRRSPPAELQPSAGAAAAADTIGARIAPSPPQTQYAKSGDVSIAYQVVGEGSIDLVLVLGFATHLELNWESPPIARFLERLSSFSRLIIFDKRGNGLSDPVPEVPTLEQRIDDVRAVMDAAGSERAALFGVSEGGPMSILFAATHPERVTAQVLHGAMARTTEAPDYPWATPAEALRESAAEFIAPNWGRDATGMLELFAPSFAGDPQAAEFLARVERSAASPAMVQQIFEMFLDIDVRAILPTIRVPTLVTHRRGDRVVNWRAGEDLAARIPGARYVELPGIDHLPWAGDSEAVIGETEEFLTGTRSVTEPDRILATVMFTDIVGSTERASELGDTRWRELLARHHEAVRRELERFRGHEVKTMGDGYLATFDGPARAIRCGRAIAETARAIDLEVRVGLHSGEVEVMDEDVGGIAVHIAARVGALADAGEVLVTSTVKDLVAGSGIAFADRGAQQLKGIPDEWRLYAAGP